MNEQPKRNPTGGPGSKGSNIVPFKGNYSKTASEPSSNILLNSDDNAVALYHAACARRGIHPKSIVDIRYRGCDDFYDLYDTDGGIHISDITGGFVIFSDWRKVEVPR